MKRNKDRSIKFISIVYLNLSIKFNTSAKWRVVMEIDMFC